jgi:hypothetical protein
MSTGITLMEKLPAKPGFPAVFSLCVFWGGTLKLYNVLFPHFYILGNASGISGIYFVNQINGELYLFTLGGTGI